MEISRASRSSSAPHIGRRFVPLLVSGAATLVCLFATGCDSLPQCKSAQIAEVKSADYVLVEYHTRNEVNEPPKVDQSSTPTYKNERLRLKAAAIRFPDTCANQKASSVTGIKQQGADQMDQSIFHTRCGVWFGELEKALAGAGFKVFSWDALRQLEEQKKISTYVAAKELGADVVFIFNDLDAGDVKAGGTAGTSYKYFASNAAGDRLQPKALEQAPRSVLHQFVERHVADEHAKTVEAIASTLDTTAILVTASGDNGHGEHADAGESIWFYRRTFRFPIDATRAGKRFLFATEDNGTTWTPAIPAGLSLPKEEVKQSTAASEETSSETVADEHDPYAEERLQVVRAAAQAFVDNFRKGSGN